MKHPYTDLVIIGGGAGGLMVGAAAGEAGLTALVLERKHKPGRKLLMCGNNRCNLSSNISAARMLEMFGPPCDTFLKPAINAFTPSQLQRWFSSNGLPTAVLSGNRVYPKSENASDVLHFFTDFLRDKQISLALSSPVKNVTKQEKGFLVTTQNFQIYCRYVMIATGGVSYPKTGSVGDGQDIARQFGHSVEDYRPGLIGVELKPDVVKGRIGDEVINVTLNILDHNKQLIAETYGAWEFTKWGIEGSTISNATRIIARKQLKDYSFLLNYPDGHTEELFPLKTRPIKEAMVTVGGICLSEINRNTMESYKCKGLYFTGEVMDVDGPTGGYNLQAAFSTARLGVSDIAVKLGKQLPPVNVDKKSKSRGPKHSGKSAGRKPFYDRNKSRKGSKPSKKTFTKH